MIVFGSHHEVGAPALRAALLGLSERASRQINGLQPPNDGADGYQLLLLDGSRVHFVIDAASIKAMLFAPNGSTILNIRDETIALDEEDRRNVTLDAAWADGMISRWLEISADYQHVDAASSKTAQLAALPGEVREQVLGVYQHVAGHMQRSGQTQQMDIHLTLPTDYWTANIAAIDDENRRFSIIEDPVFTALLEKLPDACEVIAREGRGMQLDIVPLLLKPVRIG